MPSNNPACFDTGEHQQLSTRLAQVPDAISFGWFSEEHLRLQGIAEQWSAAQGHFDTPKSRLISDLTEVLLNELVSSVFFESNFYSIYYVPADPQCIDYPVQKRFQLYYEDRNGDQSHREITTIGLKCSDLYPHIMSFCHLRSEIRVFHAYRIMQCTDMATNEPVDDLYTYLLRSYCQGMADNAINLILDPPTCLNGQASEILNLI